MSDSFIFVFSNSIKSIDLIDIPVTFHKKHITGGKASKVINFI